jgi:phosphoglycerate dehydrogenase-like enzyme
MIQANSQHIVAIDSFDPVGAQYMRDVFPGVIEPEHPNFQRLRWNATGLLVGGSSVTREDIDRSPKLRFIVRHGAGYDAVDTKACKARGIIVCNCPGVNVRQAPALVFILRLCPWPKLHWL